MHVATNLNDEQATKLTYIQQQTNQDVAEIVSQAIELYYEKIKPDEKPKSDEEPASEDREQSSSGKNLLEVFQASGLVGCLKDGDPNLSANYKSIISQELEEKYEREQQYKPGSS